MKQSTKSNYAGFWLTHQEKSALYGLPHAVRLVYYEGIRPYMDIRSGIVGIKRGISSQSIKEEIFVEPHTGYKPPEFSKHSVRRMLKRLESEGLIQIRSSSTQLILYLPIAHHYFCERNKAANKSQPQADVSESGKNAVNTGDSKSDSAQGDNLNCHQVATPNECNDYISLSRQFEKFWQAYPQKRSRQSAEEAFNALAPEEALLEKILEAINAQKHERLMKEQYGGFIPHWKNPDNWLRNRCWEDEIDLDIYKEKSHGKTHSKTNRQPDGQDHLWRSFSEESYDEYINC